MCTTVYLLVFMVQYTVIHVLCTVNLVDLICGLPHSSSGSSGSEVRQRRQCGACGPRGAQWAVPQRGCGSAAAGLGGGDHLLPCGASYKWIFVISTRID